MYDTKGLSTTITSGSGGLGSKTGLYFVARDSKKGIVTKENCGTIDACYNHGLGKNQHRTGVLESNLPRAMLTQRSLIKGRMAEE